MSSKPSAPPKPENMQTNQPICLIRLLYQQKPNLKRSDLLRELQAVDPQIKPIGDDNIMLFVNETHSIKDIAGTPGAPVLVSEAESIDRAELDLAVTQTWDWAEGEAVVANCPFAILIAETSGRMMEPKDRLANMQKVLAAILKVAPPAAIHWPQSQKIVDPKRLTDTFAARKFDDIGYGPVNVRMYTIQSTEQETVMDTLGMAAFGLPDVQCHYHSLEPKDVASCLYDLAYYLFDHGNVIDSDHTVKGCDGTQWKCSFELSIAEPKRPLIDLQPGRFAAGKRAK